MANLNLPRYPPGTPPPTEMTGLNKANKTIGFP